jgi:tRNA G26 N,N-dimethylase Trm1
MISAADAKILYDNVQEEYLIHVNKQKDRALSIVEQELSFAIKNKRRQFLCKMVAEFAPCMDLVVYDLESMGYRVECRREKRPDAIFDLTVSF